MIRAEFRPASLFGGKVAVGDDLKKYYERTIEVMANEAFEGIDAHNVSDIIITDDFINDVKAFQRENAYKSPSVTNNQSSRAFGKLLKRSGGESSVIFIDAEFGSFMIVGDIFDAIFESLTEELKAEAKVQRLKAFNLLAHELSHAELENLVSRPEIGETLESQIIGLLWLLFDEYYACRRAAGIAPEPAIPVDLEYIRHLEQDIDAKRWDYKCRRLTIDAFVRIFHDETKLVLVHAIQGIGSACGCKTEQPSLSECGVADTAFELAAEFERLFESLREGGQIEMPYGLADILIKYYKTMGVQISQQPEGVRYYIP